MRKIIICISVLFIQPAFPQLSFTPFAPESNPIKFGENVATSGNEVVVTAGNLFGLMLPELFIFEKTETDIIQTGVFTPTDGLYDDGYGLNISMDGDFIVAGSPFNDQAASDAGAVYIYKKMNGSWQFFQKLTAFDAMPDDYFGYNVKVLNNTLFVATTGDELDIQPTDSNNGSIYIYNFDGTSWNFLEKPSLANTKYLGRKMDVENDRLVVSSTSPTVAENILHTFIFNGTNWNFSNTLLPLDSTEITIKDFCLNANGLYLINAAGIGSFTDSILMYEVNGNGWNYSTTLNSINIDDNRATNIKVHNDMMLIGQTEYTLQVTRKSPLVYYKKINGSWVWHQTLNNTGFSSNDDYFGRSIAISDNLIIVGAPNEYTPTFPYGRAYITGNTLGMNDVPNSNSLLYPNPTDGQLFLSETILNGLDKIEIYQMDGKLVSHSFPAQNPISLHDCQRGIYLLKFLYNNNTYLTKKVVKN